MNKLNNKHTQNKTQPFRVKYRKITDNKNNALMSTSPTHINYINPSQNKDQYG